MTHNTLSFALLLVFIACASATSSTTPTTMFDPQKDPIARLNNGLLTLDISPETLEKAVKKANRTIQQLNSYEFVAATDEAPAFLMVRVQLKENKHQLIAFDLMPKKSLYFLNWKTEGNACTSRCCDQCQWSKAVEGTYYACSCAAPVTQEGCGTDSAGCNHTWTSDKSRLIRAVH